mmetsp:Transcript_7156/g.13113  ORF Transcript_7156/g.13113 Transcript_7156/m.13113 type:complete len:121 (+) Transcript_7156:47-409(+)
MKAIFITGPTGVGKSSIAFQLAKKLSTSIVVCDSVQIFKGYDIGSGKPSAEMLRQVSYEMLSRYEPKAFSVANPMTARIYAQDAFKSCEALSNSGKIPVIEGASTLYLKFLLHSNQVSSK